MALAGRPSGRPNHRPNRRPRAGRPLGVAFVAAALLAGALAPAALAAPRAALSPRATAGAVVYDGSSATKAAPSCWWIKQQNPAAASGVFWLQTPTLVAPDQFYCDMVTDGGGWVLVGRGREGWTFWPTGQRSALNVRSTPTGTAAFPPAALAATTIDGLLDGGSVSALEDGIVLRRAASTDGTTWQSVAWKTQNLTSWNWSFPAGNILTSTTIDGTTYAGGNTADSLKTFWGEPGAGAITDDAQRVVTQPLASHNYLAGFAYGSAVTGSTAAGSYVWDFSTESGAVPFTQVLIRPKLAPLTYSPIDPAGLPAAALPPVMGTKTQSLGGWGVTGLLKTGDSERQVDSPVLAMAQAGNTMFIGGKFASVQQGAAGTPQDQPYLAAFDRATGAWVSTFRPALDGTVWDLATTPDGKLLVTGQFTSVNGVAGTAGLALLDPATGAVDAAWRAALTLPGSTRPLGRTLKIYGGYAYVGGLFSGVTTPSGASAAADLFRVDLATDRVDAAFKPVFNAEVYTVDVTADRVYAGGYFTTVNGVSDPGLAVVDPASGALVPGLNAPMFTYAKAPFQLAVLASGDTVYSGGSQHSLQVYSAADYSLRRGFMTSPNGDFQALVEVDGYLYGGSHAPLYIYSDALKYPSLAPFTVADRTTFLTAVNERTQSIVRDWVPSIKSAKGEGVWQLYVDSAKCLWFGGDETAGSGGEWLGGFGKVCEEDSTAPTTPGSLSAVMSSAVGGGAKLTWSGSSDTGGAVTYEVIKNDRVVMPRLTALTWTDSTGTPGDRYFVRAVDTRGNRSATTAGVLPVDVTKPNVPTGLAATSAPGAAGGYDVTLTWTPPTDNVGVVGYRVYRGTTLADSPTGPTSVVPAVPAGTYTFQVAAVDAAGNVSAKSTALSVMVGPDTAKPTVPTNLAIGGIVRTKTGADVTLTWTASKDNIAVTGYLVYRNSVLVDSPATATSLLKSQTAGTWYYQVAARDAAGNVSAKTASLAVVVPKADSTPPSVPTGLGATVSLSPDGSGDVALTWTASTDDVSVTGYQVYLDGSPVASPTANSATLSAVVAGSHVVQVAALDQAGNVSALSAALAVTV